MIGSYEKEQALFDKRIKKEHLEKRLLKAEKLIHEIYRSREPFLMLDDELKHKTVVFLGGCDNILQWEKDAGELNEKF